MKYINKSLEWIPLPGLTREQIIAEISSTSAGIADRGNHVWAANINNQGTLLFCYGLQVGTYTHQGREINVWYVKRIPEAASPDVFDCPRDILDMCRMTNEEWRVEVLKRSNGR